MVPPCSRSPGRWLTVAPLALCLLSACGRKASAPEASATAVVVDEEPASAPGAAEGATAGGVAAEPDTADKAAELAPEPGTSRPRAAAPAKKGSASASGAQAEDALDASLPELLEALKTSDDTLSRLYGDTPKATALSSDDSRCEAACAAFASLKRAAEGICRLAGDSDERCTHAKQRVAHHQAKLARCACRD